MRAKRVVAIPCWKVVEKSLGQPRVVNGKGAGDAVMQSLADSAGPVLSADQLRRVCALFETLCRDVEAWGMG